MPIDHDPQSRSGNTSEVELRNFRLREYLIVLIDVLGQSQLLRSVRAWPRTPAEQEVVRDVVTQTAGFIEDLRLYFNESLEAMSRPSAMISELTAAQREEYLKIRVRTARFQVFSDLVVLSVPLDDDHDNLIAVLNVFGVLFSACIIQTLSLASRHSLRGGADAGWVVEMEEGDLYGPVLEQAHELEASIACVPRIAVGSGLFAYLDKVQSHPATTPAAHVARALARECRDLVAKDEGESVLYLDFLGPPLRRVLAGAGIQPLLKERISLARQFVESEVRRLEGHVDCRLIAKYTWLSGYLTRTIGAWGL